MIRNQIQVPADFQFVTSIETRITDVNYGGHVGNDAIFTILQEARARFLASFGWTELNFNGNGLIMVDAAVDFKSEVYYGDMLCVRMACTNIGRAGFQLIYEVESVREGHRKLAVVARTGMVCFDYATKQIKSMNPDTRLKLQQVVPGKQN